MPHLLKAETAQLQTGGPMKAIDLLEGIQTKEYTRLGYLLSQDNRYYWLAAEEGLLLFDLQEKTMLTIDCMAQFNPEASSGLFAQKDAATFYCYDYNLNVAIELTLP